MSDIFVICGSILLISVTVLVVVLVIDTVKDTFR